MRLQGDAHATARASCCRTSRTPAGSSTPSCSCSRSARGRRIHEVPVDWVDDPDSRVDVIPTAIADLRGVCPPRHPPHLGSHRVRHHRSAPSIRRAADARVEPRPPRPAPRSSPDPAACAACSLALLAPDGRALPVAASRPRATRTSSTPPPCSPARSRGRRSSTARSTPATRSRSTSRPPSLWVMELSGRIFGFSSWSMLVPQALEGVAAVGLLYATVRRSAGAYAGLVAGALLALTPVAALMFRFDNPDALLTLLLVAGAYCVTRALERAGTRWIALAGVALGFAFLTKMLQGFLVLPAFGLVYLLAAPTTAAAARPRPRGRARGDRRLGRLVGRDRRARARERPPVRRRLDEQLDPRPDLRLQRPRRGSTGSGGGGGGGGGGANFGGASGILRLFGDAMGTQIAWLLPAALVSIVAGLWLTRRRRRAPTRLRAAIVLWGGWLLVTGLVFSFMNGTVHPYYTVALAPAIAALVAIGGRELWLARDTLLARIVRGGDARRQRALGLGAARPRVRLAPGAAHRRARRRRALGGARAAAAAARPAARARRALVRVARRSRSSPRRRRSRCRRPRPRTPAAPRPRARPRGGAGRRRPAVARRRRRLRRRHAAERRRRRAARRRPARARPAPAAWRRRQREHDATALVTPCSKADTTHRWAAATVGSQSAAPLELAIRQVGDRDRRLHRQRPLPHARPVRGDGGEGPDPLLHRRRRQRRRPGRRRRQRLARSRAGSRRTTPRRRSAARPSTT